MPDPFETDPDEQEFRPPLEDSVACRRPPLRSAGSSRGIIVNDATNRQIYYESNMERQFATLMLARNDVADLLDQQPVEYVKNNKTKRHVFDFIVVMKSGEKIAVAVKPLNKVEKYNFYDELQLVAKQLDPKIASQVELVTEYDLDPAAVHDAELIRLLRREQDPEADEIIASLVRDLHGSVKVEALVELSGLGARAFRALVRALGDGHVRRVSRKRFGYDSYIRASSDGMAAR